MIDTSRLPQRLAGMLLRRRRAGDAASLRHDPRLTGGARLELGSTSFPADGTIPRRHSGLGRGDNLSPALEWSAPPAGTEQLLLVVEDVDVPLPAPVIHTVAVLPPGLRSLAEGALAEGGGIRFLPAFRDRTGWHGPRPLPGHGRHRYGFHLYALGVPLTDAVGTLDAALAAAEGRVLASGELFGYQRG